MAKKIAPRLHITSITAQAPSVIGGQASAVDDYQAKEDAHHLKHAAEVYEDGARYRRALAHLQKDQETIESALKHYGSGGGGGSRAEQGYRRVG